MKYGWMAGILLVIFGKFNFKNVKLETINSINSMNGKRQPYEVMDAITFIHAMSLQSPLKLVRSVYSLNVFISKMICRILLIHFSEIKLEK